MNEKGFEIDYYSIRSADRKVFFTIEDKRKARFNTVPDSHNYENMTYEMFQTGTVYQKEYMESMDGIKLLRAIEIEALNPEVLEIKETALDSQTESVIKQLKNRKKIIYGPALFNKTSEKKRDKTDCKKTLFIYSKK